MICIPYYSGAGHTALLARSIAQGAGGGRILDVTQMSPEDWDALDAAAVIAFGAPTYMGSTAARFDQFLEEVAGPRWHLSGWKDKLAGGFTVADHSAGDKGATLQRLATFAAQMGMIWVGQAEIGAPVNPNRPGINRDGSWLGLMATSARETGELLCAGDLETARLFGARLAIAEKRWSVGG